MFLNYIKKAIKELKMSDTYSAFKALTEEKEERRKESLKRLRRNPKKEIKVLLNICELRGIPEKLISFGITQMFMIFVIFLFVGLHTITIEDISRHTIENNLDNRYCETLSDEQCAKNIRDLTELKNNEKRKHLFSKYNDSKDFFVRVGDDHNNNLLLDIRFFDYVYFAEKNGNTKEDIGNFEAQISDEKERATNNYEMMSKILYVLFFVPIALISAGSGIIIANKKVNKDLLQYKILMRKQRLSLEDNVIQDIYRD